MTGSISRTGNIGFIWVDNPPVNAIGLSVRQHILQSLGELNADPAVEAIVLACRGKTFMAGADISEFGKPPAEPNLRVVAAALEQSAKPVIAAIHGTALGGGLELALACDYRLADRRAKLGLPEVKLGLLPGCGGTQRLPRLAGIEMALDAIASGAPFDAAAAIGKGIVDRLCEGSIEDVAAEFAQAILAAGANRKPVRDRPVDRSSLPPDFFASARSRLAREQRNLFAPQRIVDCLEAAATLPFDEGLAREREMFLACMDNPQSAALRHLFFAERSAAKVPGLGGVVDALPVRTVAVIGAGTMGGGIAMNFANAGIAVSLLEADAAALERGLAVVRGNYAAAVKKGRMSAETLESRMALIRPTTDYADLADADLVIEAVFETMAVKHQVFAALDHAVKPGAILASNTSYLSIDEIAGATSRPGQVLGLHFFSPANVMRLCEVVRGASTAPATLVTAVDIIRRIGKLPVVCGNDDGFIGNRMLSGYAREAALLSLEGVALERIDALLHQFGMAMGPFAVGDLAGLDIGYKNRRNRDPASLDPRVGFVADQLVEMGRLGQKTGAGYYDYADGSRTPVPSAVTGGVIEAARQQFGIQPREISDAEVVERCMLALVNIGADLLHRGIAYRASDIDLVYVNGYGFPAFRGGPMYWAEHDLGHARAISRMADFGWTANAWLTQQA